MIIIAVVIVYILVAWLLSKIVLPMLNLISLILIGETLT